MHLRDSTREMLYSSENEYDVRRDKGYPPRINVEVANPFCFKKKFWLSSTDVEQVLEKIGIYLQYETPKNHSLSLEQQLLITLHWLGNGCQYHDLADMHVVAQSTVCRSVNAVPDGIDHLFQEIVRFPDDCSNHDVDFLRLGRFPFVCGCVDGTLINIDAHRENESHFVDCYKNHSINTLIICGRI
ncbi:unnamed protein product [Allacma fusca]|uniref:Uncharacterized protein n=1 Tax=Allacma fusca TaxID=39272 RepID=A0A8J2L1W5_9HEXA|nr:unnamed protein product [Allacma fusca]